MLSVSLIQKGTLFQGTKGSEAIAGAIFGAASPGSGSGYVERFGRLPYTIYPAGWADDSPMDEMDLAKWPGRTYRYAQTPPLYSFAHGLQVAQFELSVGAHPSRLSTSDLDDASPASYHLSLKSQASSRYHAEAVVVAFLFPEVLKGGPHPLKQQMVGFQRVTTPLAPGASTPLEFSLNATDLSIVDPVSGDRILSPGEYTVVFSTGSRTANVTLQIDGPRRVLQPFPAAAKADDEQLPRAKIQDGERKSDDTPRAEPLPTREVIRAAVANGAAAAVASLREDGQGGLVARCDYHLLRGEWYDVRCDTLLICRAVRLPSPKRITTAVRTVVAHGSDDQGPGLGPRDARQPQRSARRGHARGRLVASAEDHLAAFHRRSCEQH